VSRDPVLRPDPEARGRLLDARLHLLDRQVHDRDDVPLTTVDDVELVDERSGAATLEPGAAVVVAALVTGAARITRMVGGHAPQARWYRIPWRTVDRVETAIHLHVRGDELDVTWSERWLRDHVIGRIPGGRHAPR
jgi:hypothetical protein